MRHRHLRALASLLLVLSAAAASAGAEIFAFAATATIHTVHWETTQRPAREETQTLEARVLVSPRAWARVVEEEQTEVADFPAGVRSFLGPEGRVVGRVSTTGIAAFRVLEFQNRLRIDGALRAAGLEADPTETREVEDLETEFGIRWPQPVDALPSEPRTLRRVGDDGFELLRAGEVVASAELWPAAKHSAPPAAPPAAYTLWLSDRSVHPELVEALVGSNRWVKRLESRWRTGFAAVHAVWEAGPPEAVEAADAAVLDAAGRPMEPAPADPGPAADVGPAAGAGPAARLVRLADRLRLGDTEGLPERETEEQFTASIEEALAAGRYLDAYLGVLGRFFQEGTPLVEDMRRVLAAGADDPRLRAFHAANPPSGGDDAGPGLAGFDTEGLERANIVRLLAANQADSRGDAAASLAGLAAVLHENPHLTGAWIDAGGLLNRAFETPRGFLFVETALSLAPDHPMLDQARSFVGSVRRDFPNLFLSR